MSGWAGKDLLVHLGAMDLFANQPSVNFHLGMDSCIRSLRGVDPPWQMLKQNYQKNCNFVKQQELKMGISEKNIEQIKQLCEEFSVKKISVFGSVLTDNFSSDSDIDFVVDFYENDPIKYTDLYFQLKDNLELILKRQIDLIEERGIKNSFFRKEIDESKVVIYG